MPDSDAILEGLTSIANGWRPLAVAWHLGLAALMAGVTIGWRPSNRTAAWLLIPPLVSVAAMAWVSNNPFNGGIFAALALLLAWLTFRLPRTPVETGSRWLVAAGALMVVFAWGYPHFLETERWTMYAYAAPLGLIPCPTLSAVIGATLILGRLGSRSWSITLAAAGIGYGAIGVFGLGVSLDIILLAGAFLLAAVLPKGT